MNRQSTNQKVCSDVYNDCECVIFYVLFFVNLNIIVWCECEFKRHLSLFILFIIEIMGRFSVFAKKNVE